MLNLFWRSLMKKFLSIILCLAVVLGAFMLLASCGANDGNDTGKADDTGKAPADATPEIASTRALTKALRLMPRLTVSVTSTISPQTEATLQTTTV